jgi:AraC-like DNA-binding protein
MATPPITITRHDTGPGEWTIYHRGPDDRLRDFVANYQGYRDDVTGGYRQVTLPSGSLVLILNFGATIRMLEPFAGEGGDEHSSFLAGLHDTHGLIEATGISYGLQVNLTPIGARLLTGLPMSELTNRVLALHDVFGAHSTDLVERLESAAAWDERFDIVDRFIARRIAAATGPMPGVAWAYRALHRTGGRANIASLADEMGWSQKHLIAQFRENIGLPPKTLARVLRFDRAVAMVRTSDPVDWAEIAAGCGYYDQAHLIRDFREFSGMTPGEFVARGGAGGGSIIEPDPAG